MAAGWAFAGQGRWIDRVGRLLCALATLWIVWILAGLLWLVSGHSAQPLPPMPAQPRREAAAPVNVGLLASFNLFGAAPPAAGGAASSAPDTTLQLRLAGVFVNATPEESTAIVAERNNPTAPAKVYSVNDSLPGGAVLVEVHDDRILIRRGDGGSEVLRFEKTNLLDSGNKAPSPVPAATAPEGATNLREALDNAVSAMGRDPDAFVQQYGLKPSPLGYEVTAATPDGLRGAAGLQPGDRILSVNGRRLGNPKQDLDVLTAVKAGGSARVEVQRGGQIVTIERKF